MARVRIAAMAYTWRMMAAGSTQANANQKREARSGTKILDALVRDTERTVG